MTQTLVSLLKDHAANRGDKVFTRYVNADGVHETTFAGFLDRASAFAHFYQTAGLGRGDTVLIFFPSSPDTLSAFMGAMLLGAIPALMPLPSAKQHPSIYWPSHKVLLERIRPRVLLTDRESAAQMDEHGLTEAGRVILAHEDVPTDKFDLPDYSADPNDVALLQHSSGTTSLKKGVALSHRAILRQIECYAASIEATADTNLISWLPLYHDMGLIACSILPLVMGQSVTVLDPFQWVARPATLFDAIEKYDGHFCWLPNFSFEHLVRAVPANYAGDLSGMKGFIDCSEACKTDTADRFVARFAGNGVRREMVQCSYGMAETVFAVTQTRLGQPVRSLTLDRDAIQRDRVAVDAGVGANPFVIMSVGPWIEGIDVTVRDGEKVLGENEIGEIVVQGSYLFSGYFNNPELTAERVRDGWYHTRDLGFVRDGEIYVLGRMDDLMIINGRNLHAHEVELIVSQVEGLKPGRAVAFGVFNEINASEELVIVAERDEAKPGDPLAISRAVREAVFEQTNIDMRDLKIVDGGWLVKTTSGKISRELNRVKYLDEAGRDVSEAPVLSGPQTDVFGVIAKTISKLFRCQISRITRDTVAADIGGWDSLAHSTLILEVEQALTIKFLDNEIFGFEDVGALVDRATELLEAGCGPVQEDRVVFQNDFSSIVRMGEAGDGPDLIIFAGAAQSFGGQNLMDFASTLSGTNANDLRKFFVTDRTKRWFNDSYHELAAKLNALSDRPKILIGNSMGGYGALKFASLLYNVTCILAFAPQAIPPRRVASDLGIKPGDETWYVRPVSDVPTCIIYGEVQDEVGKEWVWKTYTDNKMHEKLILNNCGHNVVRYLSKRGLLADVLLCVLEPSTMNKNVRELINSVEPSEDELRSTIAHLGLAHMGPALRYFVDKKLAISEGRLIVHSIDAEKATNNGTNVRSSESV